jgi:NosR/NirI family nitrous oxide reductase transcriptional regulator
VNPINKIPLKKALATLVVGAFFLFFWVKGPLQFTEVLGQLDMEETPYAIPKLVGEKQVPKTNGEIGEIETHGEGWQLLNKSNDSEAHTSTLISFEEEEVQFSAAHAEVLKKHAQQILDGKLEMTPKSNEHLLYLQIKSKGKLFYYLESAPKINHIKGYAGPINVGILITQDGKIEQVQHISSKETESYLTKIRKSGFYNSFVGLPLENEHQIDAVSGATLTTVSIAQTTSEITRLLENDFTETLDTDLLVTSFEVVALNTFTWIVHILLISLLFFYGIQKKYKKSKRDIRVLSIVSVVYIGFFMNSSFTYVSFIHPFLGTALSPLIAFYALFSLLGAIWGHNIYCSYVCPFGHAQRLALQLSKKRFTAKFFLSNKVVSHIRNALTVVLLTGILLGIRSWGNYEVFPDLFGMEFNSIWFAISIAIVAINLRYPFIWCRIACPTGAVLDGISKGCK